MLRRRRRRRRLPPLRRLFTCAAQSEDTVRPLVHGFRSRGYTAQIARFSAYDYYISTTTQLPTLRGTKCR